VEDRDTSFSPPEITVLEASMKTSASMDDIYMNMEGLKQQLGLPGHGTTHVGLYDSDEESMAGSVIHGKHCGSCIVK